MDLKEMPETDEQIINHFPGNEYHSPAGIRPSLGYYFLLGSRWYFFCKMLGIVIRGSRRALSGNYTNSFFVEQSWDFFKAVNDYGCEVHIEGLENLGATDGPAVIISNHMSSLETVLLPSMILPRKDAAFIVKKSLAEYPLFGNIINAIKHITVTRTNPREDLKSVMEKGLGYLRDGVSVIVFPQATRNSVFIPEEFNTIGIKLATRAEVPVIPLALRTNFWGNGRFLKELGPISPDISVRFKFDRPFMVSGNGKEDHQRIISFISESLDKWNKQP